MPPRLKKLSEQVVVVSGAGSGIGLAIAISAAELGARVVLSAKSENDLRDAVSQIRQRGGDALFVIADAADLHAVDEIGRRALAEFGRIDSWINIAATAIFGKLLDTSMEEKRRLFDLNFWGVVHGCRTAVKSMRDGGVLINVGSTLSDLSVPIQGIYSATQHAVRAYTDALRMELEASRVPILVSLITPDATDEVVAKAILSCCENPPREISFGSEAKMDSVVETFVPRLTDYLMDKIMVDSTEPKEKPRTLYAVAVQNPGKSAVVAAGLGVAAYAAFKAIKNVRKPGEVTH